MSGYGSECAETVRAARAGSYKVGLVLGTGLGRLADAVEQPVRIPYAHLTGFPVTSVSSHGSELVVGHLEGVPVVVLSGRAHYYEGGRADVMRTPIETLKALGCDTLILTNSAGSLRNDLPPGSAMLISDHINWSGLNPLIGEEDERRFLDMSQAYDPELRALFRRIAEEQGTALGEGIYMWFSGPSFETPAEIRMAKMLGADAVGMSTVPEVILARFVGLRVVAVSTITNFGAGLHGQALSHDETKATALTAVDRLTRLIRGVVKELADG